MARCLFQLVLDSVLGQRSSGRQRLESRPRDWLATNMHRSWEEEDLSDLEARTAEAKMEMTRTRLPHCVCSNGEVRGAKGNELYCSSVNLGCSRVSGPVGWVDTPSGRVPCS